MIDCDFMGGGDILMGEERLTVSSGWIGYCVWIDWILVPDSRPFRMSAMK